MSARIRPCTRGTRHSWSFVKNVTVSQIGMRSASFSSVGLYRCACGARKHGVYNPNGSSELLDMLNATGSASHG